MKKISIFIILASSLWLMINCSQQDTTPTTTTTTTIPILEKFISRVYLSFEQDPATSMSISWITEIENSYTLYYGTDSNSLSPTTPTTNDIHHSVKLTGLTPDTKYYYKIIGTPDVSSDIKEFTTGSTALTKYSFVSMGDSRGSAGGGVSDLLGDICQKVIDTTTDFNFILWTGDMIDWGSNSNLNLWYGWFDEVKSISPNYPILSAIGNHEYYVQYQVNGDGSNYFDFMAFPTNTQGNEQWYSFDYGNSHHIVLNNVSDPSTASDFTNGSLQYNFLIADLIDASADANCDWIFVHMHEPMYSSVSYKNNLDARTTFGPIFDQYGVDVVFAGHTHNYERSIPIKDNTSDANGIYYVVTGGAGAPIKPFDSTNWWTADRAEAYNFCVTDIDNTNLTFKAYDYPDGTEIDWFTISK